jgi:SAM-dependent methyltransferase
MSQRESGYQRKLLDQYETPEWVTLALIPHLPEFMGKILEPACGSGKMVAALRQAGFDVVGSDITQGLDFLAGTGDGCQRDHHQSTVCSGARVHRTRVAL